MEKCIYHQSTNNRQSRIEATIKSSKTLDKKRTNILVKGGHTSEGNEPKIIMMDVELEHQGVTYLTGIWDYRHD